MVAPAKLNDALQALHRDGPLSRAELARRLGVDRSTAKAISAALADDGFVREHVEPPRSPQGERSPGRPSGVIHPRPSRLAVLAIDVGATAARASIIGLGGDELARRECDRYARGFASWDQLRSALFLGFQLARTNSLQIHAIGIAADWLTTTDPGTLNDITEVASKIADIVGSDTAPITVRTRATAGVIGEYRRGTFDAEPDPIVFVLSDTHVRAGILINGTILDTHLDEFSQLPTLARRRQAHEHPEHAPTQPIWRDLVNAKTILDSIGLDDTEPDETAVRALHAFENDPVPAPLREVANHLYDGIDRIAEIISPRAIIIGGNLLSALPETLTGFLSNTIVPIRKSTLRGDSPLIGVAEAAFTDALATGSIFLNKN